MLKQNPPRIDGVLRKKSVRVPESIWKCSGIVVFGRRIKSLAFTTDLAIVRNINADAILAVYPFTPQPVINHALLVAAERPVFTGIGGGMTTGKRIVQLATYSEMQGAVGVVVNAPTSPDIIEEISENIDIPLIVTVVKWKESVHDQIAAGATILNVAAAKDTPNLVRKIREHYPDIPIIASGGNTDESIEETIKAGANAISWTPPATKEIFKTVMHTYREA